MATIGTRIHTFFCGKPVGEDEFGNRYYEERRARGDQKKRRWVMYKGLAEASKVPANWHGWLHYTTNVVPPVGKPPRQYHWQKPHIPNLTGTAGAYMPPGHVLKGGRRSPATADYQPWQPE